MKLIGTFAICLFTLVFILGCDDEKKERKPSPIGEYVWNGNSFVWESYYPENYPIIASLINPFENVVPTKMMIAVNQENIGDIMNIIAGGTNINEPIVNDLNILDYALFMDKHSLIPTLINLGAK